MRDYLLFSIGPDSYALELAEVEQVLRMVWLTPVPEGPQDVLGLLASRSGLTTVVDPRPRLQQPVHPPSARDFLIMIRVEGESVALLVNRVDDVVEAEAQPLPPEAEAPAFVRGNIIAGDASITQLDVSALLRPETRAMLRGKSSPEGRS